MESPLLLPFEVSCSLEIPILLNFLDELCLIYLSSRMIFYFSETAFFLLWAVNKILRQIVISILLPRSLCPKRLMLCNIEDHFYYSKGWIHRAPHLHRRLKFSCDLWVVYDRLKNFINITINTTLHKFLLDLLVGVVLLFIESLFRFSSEETSWCTLIKPYFQNKVSFTVL